MKKDYLYNPSNIMKSLSDCYHVIVVLDNLLLKELSNIVYDYYRINLEDFYKLLKKLQLIIDIEGFHKLLKKLHLSIVNSIIIDSSGAILDNRDRVVIVDEPDYCCIRTQNGDVNVITIQKCMNDFCEISINSCYIMSNYIMMICNQRFTKYKCSFDFVIVRKTDKLNELICMLFRNSQYGYLMKDAQSIR